MEILLETKNLSIEYKSINKNPKEQSSVQAVNDVSFKILKGEIYALAGESGCGKSTLAKSIMKLVPIKNGEILYNKQSISKHNKTEGIEYRKKVQMIFQNPYSSLNPKMKIYDILKEPLDINTKLSKDEKNNLINNVINEVGLQESSLNLYPHEFSGGQRQRIAIANATIKPSRTPMIAVFCLDENLFHHSINLGGNSFSLSKSFSTIVLSPYPKGL